jgi:hypothetical protein
MSASQHVVSPFDIIKYNNIVIENVNLTPQLNDTINPDENNKKERDSQNKTERFLICCTMEGAEHFQKLNGVEISNELNGKECKNSKDFIEKAKFIISKLSQKNLLAFNKENNAVNKEFYNRNAKEIIECFYKEDCRDKMMFKFVMCFLWITSDMPRNLVQQSILLLFNIENDETGKRNKQYLQVELRAFAYLFNNGLTWIYFCCEVNKWLFSTSALITPEIFQALAIKWKNQNIRNVKKGELEEIMKELSATINARESSIRLSEINPLQLSFTKEKHGIFAEFKLTTDKLYGLWKQLRNDENEAQTVEIDKKSTQKKRAAAQNKIMKNLVKKSKLT